MTEAEWVSGTDPTPMLEHLRLADAARMSARKRRLFACACCDRVRGLLDGDGAARLEAAERFADHGGRHDTLVGVREAAAAAAGAARAAALAAGRKLDFAAVRFAADQAVLAAGGRFRDPTWAAEKQAQAALLRDVRGNPFRPVVLDPAWLTPTVVGLARAIYQGRAFDHLPVLADALEEAGCESDAVLGHCRGPGPHIRGCWAVDLVLGQE